VHALAHSAGGFLDLPHGECNALLLEHVVRFNMAAVPERYRQVAEAMGIDTRGMAEKTVTDRVTASLAALRRRVGISDGLAARGVRVADLPELAGHAVKDACVVTNPRHVDRNDVQAIYGEAL
jgi:alcohol dehydrogenase class IV